MIESVPVGMTPRLRLVVGRFFHQTLAVGNRRAEVERMSAAVALKPLSGTTLAFLGEGELDHMVLSVTESFVEARISVSPAEWPASSLPPLGLLGRAYALVSSNAQLFVPTARGLSLRLYADAPLGPTQATPVRERLHAIAQQWFPDITPTGSRQRVYYEESGHQTDFDFGMRPGVLDVLTFEHAALGEGGLNPVEFMLWAQARFVDLGARVEALGATLLAGESA